MVYPFRLTTGHDSLGVYFYWHGVDAYEVFPLCSHARMDSSHLLKCTGLNEYPAEDIVSRYWDARRQMVKNPSHTVNQAYYFHVHVLARLLEKIRKKRPVLWKSLGSTPRQCAASFCIECQQKSCQVQHPGIRPSVLFRVSWIL
ncbi:hypothetical protein TNCV_2625831 [Trichonephila clavipes]|nr:hypothetical protein TNCV_2625831 [Trichonephila clavipes]